MIENTEYYEYQACVNILIGIFYNDRFNNNAYIVTYELLWYDYRIIHIASLWMMHHLTSRSVSCLTLLSLLSQSPLILMDAGLQT